MAASPDSMTHQTISKQTHRRFILGRQGLWPGRRWDGKAGLTEAMRSIEAVQVDPVSVIAQSHDLVLWGRVSGYQPELLREVAYTDRKFFDYGGWLVIYPMEELPFWRVPMERCKSAKRWLEFKKSHPSLPDEVKQELRDRGPLRNREFQGKQVEHYRAGKDTGVALYYLWLTGELMTYARHGKERVYDFLENVAPAHLQHTAPVQEAEDFLARKVIALDGLINARTFRNSWKGFIQREVTVQEAQTKLAEMQEAEQIVEVRLTGDKVPYFVLAEQLPTIATLQDGLIPTAWQPLATSTEDEVTFLSPLEYCSARGRAGKLFDFDYIWEIYKPDAKRVYGPYTLPVLYGDRLVARMDAKLDRQSQTLLINGLWLEDWFEPDTNFALAFARGVGSLASFLEAETIDATVLHPSFLRELVEQCLAAS